MTSFQRHDPRHDMRMSSQKLRRTNFGFGRLIDLARAMPVAVAVAKHGRPVAVVLSSRPKPAAPSDAKRWLASGQFEGLHHHRPEAPRKETLLVGCC